MGSCRVRTELELACNEGGHQEQALGHLHEDMGPDVASRFLGISKSRAMESNMTRERHSLLPRKNWTRDLVIQSSALKVGLLDLHHLDVFSVRNADSPAPPQTHPRQRRGQGTALCYPKLSVWV